MNLLIYKTDIDTPQKVGQLATVFDSFESVKSWNVDMDDIDKILRIELVKKTNERDILNSLNSCGIQIEELPD